MVGGKPATFIALLSNRIINYDLMWRDVLREPNPHPHPRITAVPQVTPSTNIRRAAKKALKILGLKQAVTPERIKELARNYFGWELMNGANIEELKQDDYWKYMGD